MRTEDRVLPQLRHSGPVRSAPEFPFGVTVTESLWPCRESEWPMCCLSSRSDRARQITLTQRVLFNLRNSWWHKVSVWHHRLLCQDLIFERLYLPKHIIHFVYQMCPTIKLSHIHVYNDWTSEVCCSVASYFVLCCVFDQFNLLRR